MKIRVIERFNDVKTDEICYVGDVIERDKERAMHMIKVGVAEKIEPNKAISEDDNTANKDEE